jgi:hypothetical protein
MPVARLQAAMALAFARWSGRRRLRQLDRIVGAQVGCAERLGPAVACCMCVAVQHRPERNGGDADIAHLAQPIPIVRLRRRRKERVRLLVVPLERGVPLVAGDAHQRHSFQALTRAVEPERQEMRVDGLLAEQRPAVPADSRGGADLALMRLGRNPCPEQRKVVGLVPSRAQGHESEPARAPPRPA